MDEDIKFLFGNDTSAIKENEKQFDFSKFFDIDVTMAKRKKMMKDFIDWFVANGDITASGNHKIPREYYDVLCKLMSYRIDDPRSSIKCDDISCMFIGKDEFNNNSIMFYTKDGKYNRLGVSQSLTCLQTHINNVLNKKQHDVLATLRDLCRPKIKEIKANIVLPVKSELSGELIYEMSDINIDHYDDDFSKVAYDWLMIMKQTIEKHKNKLVDVFYELSKIIDYDKKCFKNENINKSFISYHNNHTHLRVVSKNENLGRKKYKPCWDYLKINGCYLEKYGKTEKKLNQ